MEKEHIRSAFLRVREDILFLTGELNELRQNMCEISSLLHTVQEELNKLQLQKITKKSVFSRQTDQQTDRQLNQTHPPNQTDRQTVPQEIGGLKSQYLGISTGNEGVQTDRQTDRQTDQQTIKNQETPLLDSDPDFQSSIESKIRKASEILNSLDQLKKEIRFKFKKLTPQEMSVFSTVYQLEEQDPDNNTYQKIALTLKLSESSIRDYVQKIILKGIPIKKKKIDNKKVVLSISPEFKKIASLSTIIQLREL